MILAPNLEAIYQRINMVLSSGKYIANPDFRFLKGDEITLNLGRGSHFLR